MQQLWYLLKESILVRAIVTFMAIAATCYLFATGKPVPVELIQFDMLILGFYFGSKTAQVLARSRKNE